MSRRDDQRRHDTPKNLPPSKCSYLNHMHLSPVSQHMMQDSISTHQTSPHPLPRAPQRRRPAPPAPPSPSELGRPTHPPLHGQRCRMTEVQGASLSSGTPRTSPLSPSHSPSTSIRPTEGMRILLLLLILNPKPYPSITSSSSST